VIAPIRKHYKSVKQAIRKKNPLDPYFISKYSFSPYMACQHACKYCDGRAEKYYVEGDYERDIVIRSNLPELLEKELPKLREKGTITIGSGISDPYQPVEIEEKLLQKSLKILSKFDHSVTILTKSSLVMRDIDLLQEINNKNGVLIMISLTTLNDNIREIFEPQASTVKERLDALSALKEAGIATGVLAMPFLPFITDSEPELRKLFRRLKEIGIDFIMPGFLTLRPGIQKETYFQVLENNFPLLKNKYFELYGNCLASGNPLKQYRDKVSSLTSELLRIEEIEQQIPHRIFRNRISLTDEIYVIMEHLTYLYRNKNIAISRLNESRNRYSNWLSEKRKYFLRRRNLPADYLDEILLESFASGEMERTISNDRLFTFLKNIALDRKTFNYINLSFDHDKY
jgi:DNA repair photolyase